MKREKNGKRAWMQELSKYYGVKNGKEVLNQSRTMEKWRNLHYHGRMQIVDAMMNIQEGDVLLDLGCGSGSSLARFENKCITIGIDISDHFCHASKIKSPCSLIIKGDIEYLPLIDGCIDVCSMVYTFVYTPNKTKVLKEIHRVLKMDGRLIIFDPNSFGLRNFLRNLQVIKHKISGKNDSPSDINRLLVTTQSLNIFEFEKMASKVGLKCNSWRGNFDTIPFPVINEGSLSKVTLILFWLWEKLGCKNWGKYPLLRYFSDFLVIEFVKGDQ